MSKDLAKLIGVTGAAISQWMKPLLKKGVLM
jgi:DNA-binding transcriptional regulator YdaS (Cro superfamily)